MNAKVELDTLDDYVEQALSFNPRRDRDLLRTSLLFNLRERPDGGFAWKWDPRPMAGPPALREDWNRRRQELWERAGLIEVPTLLVRGGESKMLLPEDADELVAHMPNARWVEVENAGHTVQGDNPAGLLRELERVPAARDGVEGQALERATASSSRTTASRRATCSSTTARSRRRSCRT